MIRQACFLLCALAAAPGAAAPRPIAGPMGVTWGPTYGLPPARAAPFMPELRALGASFSRLTFYWSQLEPKPGFARWDEYDAYLGQLASPDEGMVTIASASLWATRTRAVVFPSSPATDPKAYYAFVRRVVEHAKGRVRYYQADTEPNNPFYWAGSAADYAAQQRLFYKAVKDADPNAIVVLGGSDGLFDPTGADPLPNQQADLAFLRTVLTASQGAYDLFDLHLYADPYTIPARVAAVRAMMRQAGGERSIIAAEYAGPGFFEFKSNRHFAGSLLGPGAGPDAVRSLRAQGSALPIEARMFLDPGDDQARKQLVRLQTEDLVARNMLALSAGVGRTAFFEVRQDTADRDAPSAVLFGPTALFDGDGGGLGQPLPLTFVFKRLATALAGMRSVSRVPVADHDDAYAYRVDRAGSSPVLIAWRRPSQRGGSAGPVPVQLPWSGRTARGQGADGNPVQVVVRGGKISLALTDMPVIIG
ncbi:MAG: hypothetical protein JWN66_615 [Sphingomonas bacterium]|uniref:hypothetical protein n=1 Tax=Sphingomonas bacterium TaxID=1895847 RepID=UPI0026075E71|nr:hypothetical protein [Sphingomonas bacterium]MDB5703499.1 hypothetical protein [Sphingomonas bacterium]